MAGNDFPGQAWADTLAQYHWHEELLQDPSTDLYFHAWAALTMAEALRLINYMYPEFMEIEGSLRDQLAALARLQTEAGLWRTILDDPESYEEVSATAGIGTAMVVFGYPLHSRNILRAYGGIMANIDNVGSVHNVSAGTAVMASREDYRRVPRKRVQGWGQGLTLAFLSALLGHANSAESTASSKENVP